MRLLLCSSTWQMRRCRVGYTGKSSHSGYVGVGAALLPTMGTWHGAATYAPEHRLRPAHVLTPIPFPVGPTGAGDIRACGTALYALMRGQCVAVCRGASHGTTELQLCAAETVCGGGTERDGCVHAPIPCPLPLYFPRFTTLTLPLLDPFRCIGPDAQGRLRRPFGCPTS